MLERQHRITRPSIPRLLLQKSLSVARVEADQRGWNKPIGSIWHAREFGVYRAEFYHPEEGVMGRGASVTTRSTSTAGTGACWVTGRPLAGHSSRTSSYKRSFRCIPDAFSDCPVVILISVMGLVVAALSITGVVIWWRKHQARRNAKASVAPAFNCWRRWPASEPSSIG